MINSIQLRVTELKIRFLGLKLSLTSKWIVKSCLISLLDSLAGVSLPSETIATVFNVQRLDILSYTILLIRQQFQRFIIFYFLCYAPLFA